MSRTIRSWLRWNQSPRRRRREANHSQSIASYVGAECFEERTLLSGTPFQIDVNPTGAAAPDEFVSVGDVVFFVATDGENGRELWKTDGTVEGTLLVKDIASGSDSSDPSQLTNVGGILFFAADDGVNGEELWKSDGTEEGTVLVKDIYEGSGDQFPDQNVLLSSFPSELTNVNGVLFFAAESEDGVELWKSDGTEEGTVRVRDIFSGTYPFSYDGTYYGEYPNSSGPSDLINVNGTLFFVANNGTTGEELWKSDGTEEGTVLVRDVSEGTYPHYDDDNVHDGDLPNASRPGSLTELNGQLLFIAQDSSSGRELWVSDGTSSGTNRVADIGADETSGLAENTNLTNVDGILYFAANDGTNGTELWRSDGTSEGTSLVADINAGDADGVFPTDRMASLDGDVVFMANDGTTGFELWRSDGTSEGTSQIRDIAPGEEDGLPFSQFATAGGALYFSANDGTNGVELWSTNGTELGTQQVSDLYQGSDGSYPWELTNLNGQLLFAADDGNGRELYSAAAGVHAQLTIYVNSQRVEIPTDIGVSGDTLLSQVHTEDALGHLIVESTAGEPLENKTLGDFFETWRTNAGDAGNDPTAELSPTQLFANVIDFDNSLTMFVNGELNNEFDSYVIRNEDEIILVYGSNPVVSLNTNLGPIVFELFETDTPGTVENFLNYVNDGDYANSFIHRSVEDFVIQGGGFTTTSVDFTSTSQFTAVPTDDPIENEPGISNLRGTVAMAKLSGDPDSATSQFFVNLSDDNVFLDLEENNSFTVFAQVLNMTTVDEIAALEIDTSNESPFGEMPLTETNQLVVVQSIEGRGTLTGVRFDDADRDGILDDGETLLANAVVYVDVNDNGVLDEGDISTVTDEQGRFRLDVEPGTQVVRVVLDAGQILTDPTSPESYTVTVEIGRTTEDLDFGEATLEAPESIILLASSDTGTSQTDDLTNRNNATPANAMEFFVSGVTPGAQVSVVANGVVIGTAVADGETVTITTDGETALADGVYEITATQMLQTVVSPPSTALDVTIDATAPAEFNSLPPNTTSVNTAFQFDVNSADEGGNGVVYSVVNPPAGLSIGAADGLITWTPNDTQAVPHQFRIELTDPAGNVTSADIEITVLSSVPAYPDTYTIDEDNTLSVNPANGVLANDDPNGSQPLTAELVDGPTNGTVTFAADGSFVYVPNADFFGTDRFTYKASNGTDTTNVAPVSIIVNAINEAPEAVADHYDLDEDGSLEVDVDAGLLANDTDRDGDPLTVQLIVSVSNGELYLNPDGDGSFTYIPNSDFSGTDSFIYRVFDGEFVSESVTVTLAVHGVNDAPIAEDDSFTIFQDSTLIASGSEGVLSNDTDYEDTTLTISLESAPTHGTVTLNPDGSFVYVPTATFVGTDSFRYTVEDSGGLTDTATVNITVSETEDADSTISGDVYVDESGDGVRDAGEVGIPGVLIRLYGTTTAGREVIKSFITLDDGTWEFTGLPAGTYQVTESQPVAFADGIDKAGTSGATVEEDRFTSIELTGADAVDGLRFGEGAFHTQYVSIAWFFASSYGNDINVFRTSVAQAEEGAGNTQVAEGIQDGTTEFSGDYYLNSPPTAVADSYSVDQGLSLTVDVADGLLANDLDPDDDELTATIVAQPLTGTVTLNSDGSFTYEPADDFVGTDGFTYYTTDGSKDSETTTVAVSVMEVDAALIDQAFSSEENLMSEI